MFTVRVIIKLLTLTGLLAGLIGAIKLFNSVKSQSDSQEGVIEKLLDCELSKIGIKLMFWGFFAQFSAVFCQLFYY